MVQLKQISGVSGALRVVRVTADGTAIEINPDLTIASGGALQTIGPGLGAVNPNTRGGIGSVDLQTSRTAAAAIASGTRPFAAGADNQVASASASVGERNTAIDQFNFHSGLEGYSPFRGCMVLSGGAFGGVRGGGSAQRTRQILRGTTTNATPLVLSTPTVMLHRNSSAIAFAVWLVALESVSRLTTAYRFEGLLKRVGGVCSLVGSVSKFLPGRDSGASSWDANIAANNLNGIQLTVTGGASVSVNWAALFECVEVM